MAHYFTGQKIKHESTQDMARTCKELYEAGYRFTRSNLMITVLGKSESTKEEKKLGWFR